MYDATFARELWNSLGPPDHAVPEEMEQHLATLAELPADIPASDYNPDKTDRITVRVVGPEPEEVVSSLEKAHVTQILGKADLLVRQAVKHFAEKGGKATFAEDLVAELEDHCAAGLIDAFSTVVDHSFEPSISARNKLGGFNVPLMTLLEHSVMKLPRRASVLVIEARQGDLKRVSSMIARCGRQDMTFFMQSRAKLDYTGVSTCILPLLGTTEHVINSDAYVKRFDCVLLPVNFAHFLHRDKDVDVKVRRLRQIVRPRGLICGTYVDADAVRQVIRREEYAGGFVVCRDCPDKGVEGAIISTYAGSKEFEDYVLSHDALMRYVDEEDEINVMDAVRFFRLHNPNERGDRVGREAVEMMRVVTWQMSKNPRHIPRSQRLDIGMCLAPTNERWSSCTLFAPRGRTIHVNRGMPFGDLDLFYLIPHDTYINRKVDGREAIVVFGETKTVLRYRGDDDYFELMAYSGDPYVGPAGYAIQVEVLGDKLHPLAMWVTDVLVDPGGDIGYVARMERFEIVVRHWNMPFRFPTRVRLKPYCQDLASALPEEFPSDGFVLNHAKAPSSIPGREFGPARYLKDRYTLDVVRGGVIMEVYADTLEPITHKDPIRYDKTRPNDSTYVANVKRAWTTATFIKIVRLLSQPPETFNKIALQNPAAQMPFYQLNLADLVYYWVPWRLRTLESAMIAAHSSKGSARVQNLVAKLNYQMSMELRQYGITAPTDTTEFTLEFTETTLPWEDLEFQIAPPTPLCDDWAEEVKGE